MDKEKEKKSRKKFSIIIRLGLLISVGIGIACIWTSFFYIPKHNLLMISGSVCFLIYFTLLTIEEYYEQRNKF